MKVIRYINTREPVLLRERVVRKAIIGGYSPLLLQAYHGANRFVAGSGMPDMTHIKQTLAGLAPSSSSKSKRRYVSI